ncbi:4-coumarate--CoA ligase 1 [Orussus abietinus]|uniref:4-coumarate--CoA ligase 1 n=1 Tax=Orussus abietinus TaxID=222816 RepID=UPI000624F877|nr:4-coumarate--CoA ligase 1 [Orussus abietinus]XP_012284963.1 4-coumarate--CoA ligase 1 [Orussus abietinus]
MSRVCFGRISSRYRAVQVPPIRRFCSVITPPYSLRNARCDVTREFRRFASSLLRLSEDNVVSSGFSDVEGFEERLIHELVWENLDKWPEKVAMVCAATGRSYTYSQLRKYSSRLASSFRKLELHPGSTIALVMPNIPEMVIAIFAASKAGLCITPLNPAFTALELRSVLEKSNASAVVTSSTKFPTVATSIDNMASMKLRPIVVDDGSTPLSSDCIYFKELIHGDIEEYMKVDNTPANYEDTAILPFSSGTTGLPKGVELSHRNIAANVYQTSHEGVEVGIEATGMFQDVIPLILPIFHIYGLVECLIKHLRLGAKLILLPQFSPSGFIDILDKHHATLLYLAPPLIQFLANTDLVKSNHLETVRHTISGAAPIGRECIEKFRSRANKSMLISQGYGMTETSPCITLSNKGNFESVGFVVSNTQLRVVGVEEDNLNRNLGIEEIGEVWVRGPQIMKGYFQNPEATANIMDGDWFKTGDLGYYDSQGSVYIKGRLKELIKVKGLQVAPAELEELMRGHDKIEDVAVIGVEHKNYGEIPKAFVVLKAGAKVTEDEIKDYVAQRVGKYKQLGDVQFTNKIPKSAAGKILRKELVKL